MSTRHVLVPAVLAGIVLLAAGCAESGTGPEAASSPTAAAGATATPVPTETATQSPTPAPSPTPSPRPTAVGPAVESDGCPPPAEERAVLPAATDEVPTTSNELLTESPQGRPIDVTLLAVEDVPAAQDMTAGIRGAVQDVVAAWDQAVGPPGQDDAGRPAPELQLEVTAARLGSRLVSVEMDGYRYLGGASGDGVTDAWTFSTATGQQLALADVGLGGPCLDELGQLAADALVAQGVGMFEEGEAALRDGEVALDRWAVTDTALRIHFPEYEIAPGAAGAPVAEVSLEELRAATGTPLEGSGTQ